MAMLLRRNALFAIRILSILAPAAATQAQMLGPGVDAGFGGFNGAATAPAVHAPLLTYGVDAGVGETDNVTLVPTNKISETVAIADADLAVQQQTRLFGVDAKGNFSYLDFLEGAYSPELVGRFDGMGRIALVPERVIWVLQDDFGQAQLDPFAPVTPNNRENINYLSTGPDVDLRLGSLAFVDMTARYSRTEYQTNPFDSNRILGSLAVGMPLSVRSSVSLDGSVERVLFENTALNTDFDRTSVYGHYELQGARTTVTANLGATEVDAGGDKLTGGLVKLQLLRKLSAAATLTFRAGRELTDGSSSFSASQSGASGTSPAAVTSANYTQTYASAGWQYVRNRTTLAFSGQWEKDSYAGQPLLDVDRGTAQFSVDRKLTGTLTVQLFGSVYRSEYAHVDYAETDGMIGAALVLREGRALEFKLRCEHDSRIAAGTGSGTGYAENRALLTIGYRPRPSGSIQQPARPAPPGAAVTQIAGSLRPISSY